MVVTPDISEDEEDPGLLSIAAGMQNGMATLESILTVSYETKHPTTKHQAIVLLGIYSREINICLHRSWIQMFIADLFIIAQYWK